MKESKIRVDTLLVEQGHFPTREKAKRAIMAGLVFHKETRVDKPGEKIPSSSLLRVKGNPNPYVSRGGYKLEKAITYFSLDLTDRVLLDIGSSTGGFTDCALQNGASHSYAVDVGTNQLDWKLRSDARVTVMEKTNFRHATREDFNGPRPNLATADVSFISLRHILPPLRAIAEPMSPCVLLVKPQFEAGKQSVGKKGIVRDASVHKQVLVELLSFAKQLGFSIQGLTYSPITGGDGNIEFLLYCETPDNDFSDDVELVLDEAEQQKIVDTVQEAHGHFPKRDG